MVIEKIKPLLGLPHSFGTAPRLISVTLIVLEILLLDPHETAANGTDGRSVVSYTEAGLFCETEMFSIKCFPAKVKDVSTSFSIIWRIIF